MDPRRVGLICMVFACLMWGFSTLYFHALRHVPPGELLSWRVVSSFVLFALVLAAQGRLRLLALMAGLLLIGWSIMTLVYYSIRDRK